MKSYTTAEMKRFNYLMGETDAAYHEAALRLGISDSVMRILYTICDNGDSCPLGDICRLSEVSKQTVNSALRKLEKEGIIYLEAMGGKRKRVCLTEEGRELARRTAVRLIEIENSILEAWSGEELEQFLALNQKYLDMFRERVQKL